MYRATDICFVLSVVHLTIPIRKILENYGEPEVRICEKRGEDARTHGSTTRSPVPYSQIPKVFRDTDRRADYTMTVMPGPLLGRKGYSDEKPWTQGHKKPGKLSMVHTLGLATIGTTTPYIHYGHYCSVRESRLGAKSPVHGWGDRPEFPDMPVSQTAETGSLAT